MTKRDQQKALKDFEYFFTTYWIVRSYTRNRTTINPYNFQWQITRMLSRIKEALINTARRMGITTMLVGYSYWKMLSVPNTTIVVTGVNDIIAGEFLDKMMYSYDKLPAELKLPLTEKTAFKLQFENGAKLLIISPNTEQLKEEIDIAVVDNANFISNLVGIQQVLRQSLKPTGCLITVSTLYKNTEFAKQCVEAREGIIDVEYLEITADIIPYRGKKWFENKAKKSSPEKVKVETSPFYYLEDDKLVHINNWGEEVWAD